MILSIVDAALKLGDKLIEDKDQKAQLANDAMKSMLASRTYRWIDGLVKLAYAADMIMKGLFRPLGSIAMFCFGAYCTMNSIELPPMIHELLYGAPLGWGVSRHLEKGKKKAPQKEELYEFED